MSIQFGGGDEESRSQTQFNLSPAQEQLVNTQNELAMFQLFLTQKALQEQEAAKTSPAAQTAAQLERRLMENALARAEGRAPVLAPEAAARIATTFGAREVEGLEAIRKQFGEMAASRGMTRGDSPIAAEEGKALADFLRGLQAARASSELDVGQTEALFNEQMRAFQESLRQQAFQNRLGLIGAQPGLGYATLGLQSAPRTQLMSGTQQQMGGGFNLGQLGQLASGVGSLYGAWRGGGGGAV